MFISVGPLIIISHCLSVVDVTGKVEKTIPLICISEIWQFDMLLCENLTY